ncbi:hypothetical protein FQN57_004983 [Myotisia sp. PD_48]|nr:hypothetical protein FQN57_004983 [Myotisia sp. PD_48]
MDQASGGYDESILATGMNRLYEKFQNEDEVQAHSWRSQTLRLLHSPETMTGGAKQETMAMRNFTCESSQKNFSILTASLLNLRKLEKCDLGL